MLFSVGTAERSAILGKLVRKLRLEPLMSEPGKEEWLPADTILHRKVSLRSRLASSL